MNGNQRSVGFAELARRYIDVVDTPPEGQVEFLTRIETLLAQLVASAYGLPQVEPTTSEPGSRSVVPPTGLGDVIGDADLYWDVLDPWLLTETPEVGAGSLTDDLSD